MKRKKKTFVLPAPGSWLGSDVETPNVHSQSIGPGQGANPNRPNPWRPDPWDPQGGLFHASLSGHAEQGQEVVGAVGPGAGGAGGVPHFWEQPGQQADPAEPDRLCCIEDFKYPTYLTPFAVRRPFPRDVMDSMAREFRRAREFDVAKRLEGWGPALTAWFVGFAFEAEARFEKPDDCVCACCRFEQTVDSSLVADVGSLPEELGYFYTTELPGERVDVKEGQEYGLRESRGRTQDAYVANADWDEFTAKLREQRLMAGDLSHTEPRMKGPDELKRVLSGEEKDPTLQTEARLFRMNYLLDQFNKQRMTACRYWMVDQPYLPVFNGVRLWFRVKLKGHIKPRSGCSLRGDDEKQTPKVLSVLMQIDMRHVLHVGAPMIDYEVLEPVPSPAVNETVVQRATNAQTIHLISRKPVGWIQRRLRTATDSTKMWYPEGDKYKQKTRPVRDVPRLLGL